MSKYSEIDGRNSIIYKNLEKENRMKKINFFVYSAIVAIGFLSTQKISSMDGPVKDVSENSVPKNWINHVTKNHHQGQDEHSNVDTDTVKNSYIYDQKLIYDYKFRDQFKDKKCDKCFKLLVTGP